jgi:hypothetical protein
MAWVSALAVAAAVLTAGGALAGNDSKNISDGVAKGQATEGVAQPTTDATGAAGGPTGLYVHRKLPGRMKSGSLSLTPGATGSPQDTTTQPDHNNMIGNHKD